jgi:peptidoglycan/LPS O-acetylase OafA/YrhL
MKRIGPWAFAAGALAITLAFRWAAIDIDGNFLLSRHLIETAAPFRIFEFALGMGLGYLMVRRPELMLEYTRAPLDIAGIVFIGLLLFIGGNLIDPLGGEIAVLIDPMVTLGVALIVLPLIMKIPGSLEVSAPGRVLAWVGVISYTVLIINEPLRFVTHTLRNEDAAWAWQALWIGVLYMPITLIAARPLAVLLGLVERGDARRESAATGASATEAPSLQA